MQDREAGGFSGIEGRDPDLFHTHFAVAALALLPATAAVPVAAVDPVFCLPQTLVAGFEA